jgi:hypothetical protein
MADRIDDEWGNDPDDAQHVRIRLKLAGDEWDTDEDERNRDLEEELEQAIRAASVGQYDGIESGLGFFDCVLYRPDAEQLAAYTLPIVCDARPRAGSYFVLRAGPPGTTETRMHLDAPTTIDD